MNAIDLNTRLARAFGKIAIVLALFRIYTTDYVVAQNQSQLASSVGFANLHQVSNEKLIEAATNVAKPPYDAFLSEMRGLSQVGEALNVSKGRPPVIPLSQEDLPEGIEDPLELAAASLVQAKKIVAANNLLANELSVQEGLYEEYIRRLNAAETAANILLQSFDDLAAYSLELQLRIDDKTVEPSQIPDVLNRSNVNSRRRQAAKELPVISARLSNAEEELRALNQKLDNANESVRMSEASLEEVETTHSLALRQQNLEKEFVTKAPALLIGELVTVHRVRC